jgi:hypothetical protein
MVHYRKIIVKGQPKKGGKIDSSFPCKSWTPLIHLTAHAVGVKQKGCA